MMYSDVVEKVAPCGLDCSRCVSCSSGRPREAALSLARAVQGFAKRAPVFAERTPALRGWAEFEAVLAALSEGSCSGCRGGAATACNGACRVKDCVKERCVDFCFQCPDYPCQMHGLFPGLEARWRENQDAMRASGAEAWYDATLARPRY